MSFTLWLIIAGIICALYITGAILVSRFCKKYLPLVNIIALSLFFIYAILLLIFLPAKKEKYQPLSTLGMYIFSFMLIIATTILAILFGKNKGMASQTKSIAFAGISIALAFALSFIKLFSLPQGGSITLASMLPLVIYSYIFGARKGVFCGILYGLLQIIQSPQIYQPMQVLLDYPVAFGIIGLSGMFKNFNLKPLLKFIFGAIVGLTGRYLAHFLSGYYVFSSWAMEGYTALTWSLVYNLFVFVELGIVLVVGIFLFSSKSFNKELDKINPPQLVMEETQNN